MEDKIKLIDKIVELHPTYGEELGWSTYTGGMADTGRWFFRKMLDEPIEKLQQFYNGVLEEKANYKPEVLSDEDLKLQNTRTFLTSGNFSNALEDKRQKQMNDEIERRLFFGE